MNKKGMTMVELIVSFALTAIIAFFLTEVVLFLRQAYVGNGIKTELISKQTLISTKINDLFNSKRIKEAKDCGDGCVELTFDDNSIEQISFNSNTNLVSIGGYVVKLPESAVIGTTAIDTTSLENNDKFNSIFQIYVPITSKLLNGKNFDVNIIYQYNKNTEDWSYNSSVKTYHIASPTQTLITQGETLNLLNGISFVDESNNSISADIKLTSIPEFNSNNAGDYDVSYSVFYNGRTYIAKRVVRVYKSDYAYTGDYQKITIPINGWYKIELWGASGGNGNTTYLGGNGGYTSGKIYLTKGEIIYLYIGGPGTTTTTSALGGYNGGGACQTNASNISDGCGGGATDIRYFGTTIPTTSDLVWNSTLGLNSRLMVAGGGGGGQYRSDTNSYGGGGGGLIGNSAYSETSSYAKSYSTGGTQTAGGAKGYVDSSARMSYLTTPSFGVGGSYTSGSDFSFNGGGGGYYGGGSGVFMSAGGGSSFISGHSGVNAITSSASLTPTNNTLHYSGRYFIDTKMQAAVNSGNGKAKITYISDTTQTRTNTGLNNVRYIKDCINGNTTDTGDHWVELQAIYNGTNIAKSKIVAGTIAENATYPYSRIVDGDITTANYAMSSATGLQCVIVDLGIPYNLDEVAIWHYWGDGRTYNSNTTYVSSNNSTWTTLISTPAVETANGKRVNAYSS